jgi:hypothetical protein
LAQDKLKRFVQPTLFGIEKNRKEKPTRRTPEKKKEVQQMLAKIKEESGCIDCNKKYPSYVLDFDHVYGKKVANIGQMLNYFSVEDILKEVAKCDIICSNCHRIRTYLRKHSDS